MYPDRWLRCSAPVPLWCSVCRGHAQYPAFAPDTQFLLWALQKWQIGVFFWSFWIFWSRICPNCACIQLFLVPYSFFVFGCLRRNLSRCKHCSKGSQVPACLRMTSEKKYLRSTLVPSRASLHGWSLHLPPRAWSYWEAPSNWGVGTAGCSGGRSVL